MDDISLMGWCVVIAGGDAREVVLASELQKKGADVRLLGFDRDIAPAAGKFSSKLPQRADAVICPLPGIYANGDIYAPLAASPTNLNEITPVLHQGTLFLAGNIPENIFNGLMAEGVRVIQTSTLDELCLYNAVPTAEGAVLIALGNSDITIHGSHALVLGFGRCGVPLARLLQGMDAVVTVAVRRRDVIAQASNLGFRAVEFSVLERHIGRFDYIFNTVPATVLTENLLQKAKREALIVDIASSPGGTDFKAAEALGIKSILAPGLPGKTAPVSAGRILGDVYSHLLISKGRR